MKPVNETPGYDISPCVTGDCLHKKNVVSKLYITTKSGMEHAMQEFMVSIVEASLTPASLPFFAMNVIDTEFVKIHYYISITENNPRLPDGFRFDSYFAVENMVSLCISKNVQSNMSEAYVKLHQFLDSNHFQATTPVFQVLGGDKKLQYTFLKVGYRLDS